MKTYKITKTIEEIFKGYVPLDEINDDEKIFGYNKKLTIRPPYQREFIYDDEKQKQVIESVINSFPLNTIFWVKISDNFFELLDGQQRILSICQFLSNKKSFNFEGILNGSKINAYNLQNSFPEIYKKILKYELDICVCSGTNEEKLKWFDVINTAGDKLNKQELRNAIYTGEWLTDAKKYFGKGRNNCLAIVEPMINNCKIIKYNDENAGRQLVLELALDWIKDYQYNNGLKEIDSIESYMNKHCNDENANELKDYWNKVVRWVLDIFGYKDSNYQYASEIQEVDKNWGFIYNKCWKKQYNIYEIQREVEVLMNDDEIMKKNGIFGYVLTRDITFLNFRKFDNAMKRKKYHEQKGICPGIKEKKCDKAFTFNEMEGDHIKPWSEGGKTEYENLQMLCKDCNRRKSNK